MNSKVSEKDVRLSKKLSYFLRHAAVKEKVIIKPDGFANVESLLARQSFVGYGTPDVRRVVAADSKQRFALREENGVLKIRANQGHTIKEITQLDLRPVENPDFPIIHGTYLDRWQKIRVEGLSRMKRNHIHFAKGLNFQCGLRKSAEIFIFIDFPKARAGNLEFFESENGVILCAGDDRGILEKRYFSKVIDRDGEKIPLGD